MAVDFEKIRVSALGQSRFIESPGMPGSIVSPLSKEEVGFAVSEAEDHTLDVRYFTPGCGYYHAAAAALCEVVNGSRPEVARAVTQDDLAGVYGGYPKGKEHYLELSIAAFLGALRHAYPTLKVEIPELDKRRMEAVKPPSLDQRVDLRALLDHGSPTVSRSDEVGARIVEALRLQDDAELRRIVGQVRLSLSSESGPAAHYLALLGLELVPGDPQFEQSLRISQNAAGIVAIPGPLLRPYANYIPSGLFQRGSDAGDVDEQPPHDWFVKGFWIDRDPVDHQRLHSLLSEDSADDPSVQQGQLPVTGVSWHAARSLGGPLGADLPTEAEWEKAAKGGYFLDGDFHRAVRNPNPGRLYPWGDEPPGPGCAMPGSGHRSPVATESNPDLRSPYGIFNMAGNVWEWCQNPWDPHLYARDVGIDLSENQAVSVFPIRGGAWNDIGTTDVRTTGRYYDDWFAEENVNGVRFVYRRQLI